MKARLALTALAALCWHGAAMAASDDLDDLVQARLVAEDAGVKPGGSVWLALHLTMKKGWHTYWRNPGDSGQPTEIEWTLPPGFAAGEIHWPAPKQIPAGIGVNYGYEDSAALLVPVQAPADAKPGAVEVSAEASWLVCEAICVPGEAKLSLKLNVGDAAPDPAAKALFAAARAALPSELKSPAKGRVGDGTIALELPAEALKGMTAPAAAFMPFDDTLIDHAAPQLLNGATLALKRGPVRDTPPAGTGGVLLVEDKGAGLRRAFNMTVEFRRE